MARYRFTEKAVADLTQNWNYTLNNWSENQADKYYWMILDNCSELASNPDLGKYYSIVNNNLFGLRAGRHIIYYRKINDEEIEIIRILHEQMDLKNRLKDNNPT